MAFLLLAFSAFYTLLWAAGLLLTLKSDGERNLPVPVIGLLAFLGLSGYVGMAANEAMNNPPKVTAENYGKISEGASLDDVTAVLGAPAPDDKDFDFASYRISFPEKVTRRLRSGMRKAERVEASVKLKIKGEPSKANLRRGEGLGAPANAERGGLMGLTIVLTENENETRIVEGEHWTYEDDMSAEDVAKKIAEAIDATDAWTAEGSTDDEPTMITIEPELEANFGSACNDGACTVQIAAASEPEEEGAPLDVTGAVRIRSRADGKPADLRGGEDETFVKIWQEDGVLLDGDFSTDHRMIIAGFIKGELVGKTQANLGIEEAPAEDEGGE
jgi:hypothetical protein